MKPPIIALFTSLLPLLTPCLHHHPSPLSSSQLPFLPSDFTYTADFSMWNENQPEYLDPQNTTWSFKYSSACDKYSHRELREEGPTKKNITLIRDFA